MDRLTKSAYFLPMKTKYDTSDYTTLFIKEIVRMHGVSISIVLDKGHNSPQRFGRAFKRPWARI